MTITTPASNIRLTTRQEGKQEERTNRTWGDEMASQKCNKNIRIIFQNINGFGYTRESLKSKIIKAFLTETEADIFGMSEVNVNWRITAKKNHIKDITRGWFEQQRTSTGYNQHDRSCDKYQPGGTGIISLGEAALRVMQTTQDPKRLGRWVSTLYRGKHNIKLRVIAAYFPNIPQLYGNKKVYCQQQKVLLQMEVNKPVAICYWEDF